MKPGSDSCPYLALASKGASPQASPSALHYCNALDEEDEFQPALDHQSAYCLSAGYDRCLRYRMARGFEDRRSLLPWPLPELRPLETDASRRLPRVSRRSALLILLALVLIPLAAIWLFRLSGLGEGPAAPTPAAIIETEGTATASVDSAAPTPAAVVVETQAPAATPVLLTATPTPRFVATPTPLEAVPVNNATVQPPIMGAGDVVLLLTPAADAAGSVSSADRQGNRFGESVLNAGALAGQIYHGAVQFDLSQLPPGAAIRYVSISLTGLDASQLDRQAAAQWHLRWLAVIANDGWTGRSFEELHNALVMQTLLPAVEPADLNVLAVNEFVFSQGQIDLLQRLLDAGFDKQAFRLDGPDSGETLFAWDSGYGPESGGSVPVMMVIASAAGPGSQPPAVVETAGPSPTAGGMPSPALASTPSAGVPVMITATITASIPVTATATITPSAAATAAVEGETPPAPTAQPVTATPTRTRSSPATSLPGRPATATPRPAPPAAGPSPTPVPVRTPATAGSRIAASVEALNVRNGPGSQYPVLRVMLEGQEAELVSGAGGDLWWLVRFDDGEEGWVSASLVRPAGSDGQPPAPQVTSPPAPQVTSPPAAGPGQPSLGAGTILFFSDRLGEARLFAMDGACALRRSGCAAAAVTPVTDPAIYDRGRVEQTLSPDGQYRVVVQPDHRNIPSLAVENVVYGTGYGLTYFEGIAYSPAWSPVDDLVALVSDDSGNDEIYTITSDGSKFQQLTENQAYDKSPTWSPDGASVLFESTRSGRRQLWIMGADGSDQRNVSDNAYSDWAPVWLR